MPCALKGIGVGEASHRHERGKYCRICSFLFPSLLLEKTTKCHLGLTTWGVPDPIGGVGGWWSPYGKIPVKPLELHGIPRKVLLEELAVFQYVCELGGLGYIVAIEVYMLDVGLRREDALNLRRRAVEAVVLRVGVVEVL